ncbi:LexA family transcriptional regulator [Novosphingobium resinovorum]|uniref:LexA family protein n=1 Tax=Novosphingobium resinovorum TaxID=158500 RepID=UPI002ED0A905|nr:LexA family transcriptional regulator [Novosphingobium resinovorum]
MSNLSEAIPNRVRALRAERGWSLAELADRAGTTASQVMKLEKSQRRLNFDWVRRLAAAFEISEAELMGQNTELPLNPFLIPLIGEIAAGNWREAIQHYEDMIFPPVEGLSKAAFALRTRGDSMDRIIPDGGYVVIDPGEADLREGRVYAVMNSEGETTIKRFRSDPARLEPCSTNPDHQPISLGREQFTVIGMAKGAFVPL